MTEATSMLLVLKHGVPVLAAVLLGIASLNDIAVRTIPDTVPLALFAIGIAIRLAGGNAVAAFVASTAVFLLGGLCWRFGWLGGGDVKLLASCAWLVSPALVPQLLMMTAIAGGVLACLYLALSWRARMSRQPSHSARPHILIRRICHVEWWRIRRRAALPYGCAIAVGTLLTMSGW